MTFISFRAPPGNKPMAAFFREYTAATKDGGDQGDLTNARWWTLAEGRAATVVMVYGDQLDLNRLFVPEKHRRGGCATAALRRLFTLADRHQLTVALTCQAFGMGPRLETSQLEEWYRRQGFQGPRRHMFRAPVTTLSSGKPTIATRDRRSA